MSNRQLSNGPYFITTAPSLSTCRRCGQHMLAATVDGLDRRVDVATLNEVGELTAMLAGRATFEVRGELLIRRTALQIKAGREGAVLAEHNCSVTPPDHIDGSHMQAAIFLVQQLLGATPLIDVAQTAPF